MTKRKKKVSKKTAAEENPATEETVSENATEKSGFSFDSIASAHDEIQDSSSDPNESAIAAQATQTAETAKAVAGNVDSDGTVFNPELHAVNKDGEPSVTPTGKFRKKRGASKLAVTNEALAVQQAEQQKKESARAAGQLAADMLIGSTVMLMGPEWQPLGPEGKPQQEIEFNEHANLRRAFADYFEAKGISDFPPGIALSIALSSYAMPRLVAGEETKSKLQKAKIKIAAWWINLKEKRKKNAAQSDSRDDGKRKDDAGKKAMQSEPPAATRHART